jgi:hypothetical protein
VPPSGAREIRAGSLGSVKLPVWVAPAAPVDEADGDGVGEPDVAPLGDDGTADEDGLPRPCGVPPDAEAEEEGTVELCDVPLGCAVALALADELVVLVLDVPAEALGDATPAVFGWKLRGR